jgi:hypothetical protein
VGHSYVKFRDRVYERNLYERRASQAEKKGAAQGSSEKQPRSGESRGTPTAVKGNKKYALSLLLYRRPDSASPSYLRIRNDKTGKEVTPRSVFWEEAFPANAPAVWSPDEEYLVLACGEPKDNFCVYQSAQLAKLFEDDSLQNDLNLKSLAVVSRERDGEFHHLFTRWKGNNSFIFKVTDPRYVGKMNCNYEYDILRQRLRFLSGVCG